MSRLQPFGPYHLVERIGVGATSEVWRAIERAQNRVVALKRASLSNATPDVAERLKAEAELVQLLDHPQIAKVFNAGVVGTVPFIAYEYVHGRDLRAIQARAAQALSIPPNSPPNPREAELARVPIHISLYIIIQVAQALAHAHDRRGPEGDRLFVVHRDVGPTNILVGFDGSVKLIDFGIARAVSRNTKTGAHQVRGTVAYMSPEQVRGEMVDARSDQYSVGVCLWELLAGHKLFGGIDTAAVTQRILDGDIPSLRALGVGISPSLEAVITKALAQTVEQRYPTAAKLAADLVERARAESLWAEPDRVSHYLRSLFPEVAAEEVASREEFLDMADDKAGSDLDVFEGLAKKSTKAPKSKSGLPPPPSRKQTLLGGLGVPPPAPSGLPAPLPPPGSAASAPPAPPPASAKAAPPPPPPPAKKSSATLIGINPHATSQGLPLPVPPPSPAPGSHGAPPPQVRAPASVLPPPPRPPSKAEPSGVLPAPLPPPADDPMFPPPEAPPAAGPDPTKTLPAGAGDKGPSTAITAGSASHRPPAEPGSSVSGRGAGAPHAPVIESASTLAIRSGVLPAPLPPPQPLSSRSPGAPFMPAPSATTGQAAKPPAPLPPPAAPAKGKAKAVDMDWDDEEESTHVFDKQETDAEIQAVVGAAKSKAGALPAPPKKPVPSIPPPAAPSHLIGAKDKDVDQKPTKISPAEPKRDDPTTVTARPKSVPPPQPVSGASRVPIVLAIVAVVVAVGVGVFMMLPKTGELHITVTTKSGAPVDTAAVYVNGAKKCDISPCTITELPSGPKDIKVMAPPFQSVSLSETVEPGRRKDVNVTLEGGGSGSKTPVDATTASSTTELKIAGTDGEKAVRVLVDGTDKGNFPVDLKDLPAGSHTIKFDGGDRYEKPERTVDLQPGKVVDLGVIKLKVLKGSLTVELATAGANVTLSKGTDKRSDKKLDALFKNPPVKLDLDTKETWRLTATKKGFDDFRQDVSFDDGQAEKTISVQLSEAGKPTPPSGPVTPSGPPATGGDKPEKPEPAEKPEKPAPVEPEKPQSTSGQATLNLNSIPPSKVLVDGAPQGSTPKMGVSVSAGSHRVTFVHPDYGSKSVTVSVKAGESKTAAVKFEH